MNLYYYLQFYITLAHANTIIIFLVNAIAVTLITIAALQTDILSARLESIYTIPELSSFELQYKKNKTLIVIDDNGTQIRLKNPIRRIITLAPHAAELVYAAGAGDYLIGVVEFSDYPKQVLSLPHVGDSMRINKEVILTLHPDLIIAWPSGNRPQDLTWLEQHGFAVYRSEPATLEAIADNLLDLGILTATTAAKRAAINFSSRLIELRKHYIQLPLHSLFYQVWFSPLITLGSTHLINQVFKSCGGQNLFPHLKSVAAVVSKEAVLTANPYAIIIDTSIAGTEVFSWWQRWIFLDAVRWQRFIDIPAELLQRPTPRILDGLEQLCSTLHSFTHSSLP